MAVTLLNPLIDAKLSHIKSDNFLRTSVSQTNVIHMTVPGGPGKFSLIFSSEAIDLISESITPTELEPGLYTATLTENDMNVFRLQVANLTFEAAGAKQLYEALGNALVGAGLIDEPK